jgi:hypothetical protein
MRHWDFIRPVAGTLDGAEELGYVFGDDDPDRLTTTILAGERRRPGALSGGA